MHCGYFIIIIIEGRKLMRDLIGIIITPTNRHKIMSAERIKYSGLEIIMDRGNNFILFQ